MNSLLALETPRLILRKYQKEDAAFVYTLMNDADFIRFIGDRNIQDEAAALSQIIEPAIKAYDDIGMGMLVVIQKETQKPVGLAGMLQRDFLPEPDIGYAFSASSRGQGFAFEATQALMDVAKESRFSVKINAIVHPDNASSIGLLKKLGFEFVADAVEGAPSPTYLFTQAV